MKRYCRPDIDFTYFPDESVIMSSGDGFIQDVFSAEDFDQENTKKLKN